MFTGIVTDVGRVAALDHGPEGARLRIVTAYEPAAIVIGGSIACGGACLTVVETGAGADGAWFSADVSAETLSVTTLGGLVAGDAINLERPLRAGEEFGGHIVQGHVDAVAEVVERQADGSSVRFRFRPPSHLARFIAAKGSVALDGTSLTVNDVAGSEFGVNIVPHTLKATTWGERSVGDRVNLEVDIVARYLDRLAGRGGEPG